MLLYEVKALRLQFELCHFGEQPVQAAVGTGGLAGAVDASGDAVADRRASTGVRAHRLRLHLSTGVQTQRYVSRHLKQPDRSRGDQSADCFSGAIAHFHLYNTYTEQRGVKYRCPER